MEMHHPEVLPEVRESPTSPHSGDGSWPWFGRVRWLLLCAGLLAGLAAFGVGELTHALIPVERIPVNLQGSIVMEVDFRTVTEAATRNGALTYGVMGLFLGAALGIAGGMGRRSTSGSVGGGVLGALLGAALGGGPAFALLTRFLTARDDHRDYEILISLAMHGVLWGLIGAAAGLAFGVGLGRYRRCLPAMLAGLLGASLAAIVYDLIGASLLPQARTDEPLAVIWTGRILACMLVAVGSAVAVATLALPDTSPTSLQPPAGSPESAALPSS